MRDLQSQARWFPSDRRRLEDRQDFIARRIRTQTPQIITRNDQRSSHSFNFMSIGQSTLVMLGPSPVSYEHRDYRMWRDSDA